MTLFSVGYGDLVPHTNPGKVLACIVAIWGAILISLCVVTVTNIFNLNEKQNKALKQIKLSHSAAQIIN